MQVTSIQLNIPLGIDYYGARTIRISRSYCATIMDEVLTRSNVYSIATNGANTTQY